MSRISLLSRIQAPVKPLFHKSPGQIISRQIPKNQFFKRFQSTLKSSKPAPPQAPNKPKSLKHLMKEYGYAGLGVYLALSFIDLPICYVMVHSMGKDQIEYYENKVKQTFGYGMSDEELKKKHDINKIEEMHEQTNSEDPNADGNLISFLLSQFSWTEFAIAYGIHKSLIFIRLPITAAITPGIVKGLRNWGFKIGSDKLSTTASIAKDTIKDITASSQKFGTRPNGKKKWFSWFF
ncbi:uncharacterized protein AC631_03230 [Debaryomyces fabryi]|uniref:DUF1279 domain-containing protein n=1 Tax=Debaryomyces fabryi TaxID=58627 RepID=A0A0V1PXX1_9ASCO|nr:uncharacterized protein AC631_03230 [Debaryomyces fabryi]KSA01043.1 hypothetical protein AC631_03230 [Debaryomyces fabryi]CUM51060.1 unnamed protein product [Debaryomyces fabryi]